MRLEIEWKTKMVRDAVNDERLELERKLKEQKDREDQKILMRHRLVKE